MIVRVLRLLLLPVAAAAPVIAVAAACNGDTGIACQKDTDCPTGNICRDAVCGLTNPDAGVAETSIPDLDTGTGTCSNDGTSCTIAAECCSGQCTQLVCGANANTCKNANELCQNDCCTGLTCVNGACQ